MEDEDFKSIPGFMTDDGFFIVDGMEPIPPHPYKHMEIVWDEEAEEWKPK
jgi:hypothetical protein